ncbi:MAG TPA: hypothetical protein VNZ47_05235 [Candidatus Dormibacteraeota bacterium]|jgi:hypothetical protein|nr:hypothetical protein [Candidatus Dormibacteraeota bacterium]
MAWLWNSWEEYVNAVHPAVLESPGLWRLSHQDTSFTSQCNLSDAARRFEDAAQSLRQSGFRINNHKRATRDSSTLQTAERIVLEAIYSGEALLLYNKLLALSDASYGFLHQNHLLKHWDRYKKSDRIFIEVEQFLSDIGKLLKGYQELVAVDRRFLVDNLDLPPLLEADLLPARNLFSCGFDEAGVFMAGRGLEGVLRKIAAQRKIVLEIKGKPSPASEGDFRDLIEVMFHIRWKTKERH